MAGHLKELTEFLRSATARIAPEYFLLPLHGAESWAQAYVASGNPGRDVAKLKAQDGKPMAASPMFRVSLITHPGRAEEGRAPMSDSPIK